MGSFECCNETSGSIKRGISLTEDLVTSEKGLCSTRLIGKFIILNRVVLEYLIKAKLVKKYWVFHKIRMFVRWYAWYFSIAYNIRIIIVSLNCVLVLTYLRCNVKTLEISIVTTFV